MPSTDVRLLRLEADLERLKPTLAQRIERLEEKVKKGESFGKQLLKLLGQALVPVISGAVILILGYAVKDSVDQALARQQLQLSYATEMQELLEKMSATNATREQVEAAALVLATFGENAVVPLINELQLEGSIRALAAESGLRAMALMETSQHCNVLVKILSSRSRLYRWETHRRVIRLLGDLDCRDAVETLQEYEKLISKSEKQNGFKDYTAILRRDSSLNIDSIQQIKKTLGNTMEVLRK